MPTDSEHLRVVLEAAYAYLGCPEAGDPSFEATSSVFLMLSRLEEAEKHPSTMLDIAHDIMADYGFKAIGVRHKDDPPGVVEPTMRLHSGHLSPEAFDFINADPYFDDKTMMMHESSTTIRLLLRAPKTGHELPRETPRDLVALLNVAIMRKVDILFFAPECPVFAGLPLFKAAAEEVHA